MANAGSVADRELAITTERLDGQITYVAVAGEVDLATAPQLRIALLEVVGAAVRPGQIVVDVAEVRFMDAVGIGVLVSACNTARQIGVGFSVRNPTGVVLRLIELLGLAEAWHVTPPPRVSGGLLLRRPPQQSTRGS